MILKENIEKLLDMFSSEEKVRTWIDDFNDYYQPQKTAYLKKIGFTQ